MRLYLKTMGAVNQVNVRKCEENGRYVEDFNVEFIYSVYI